MATKLEICQHAQRLIGDNAMTSLGDGSAASEVVANVYGDFLESALVSSRWRFATKQEVLAHNATDPISKWGSAFDLPSDMLMLNSITVNESVIQYDVYGDKIYCNEPSTATVVADYVYRPTETSFPPYFVTALEYGLAAIFAMAIARDQGMYQLLEQKSELYLARARRLDSQQQTTRRLNVSRFIQQRRS